MMTLVVYCCPVPYCLVEGIEGRKGLQAGRAGRIDELLLGDRRKRAIVTLVCRPASMGRYCKVRDQILGAGLAMSR